MKKRLFFVLSMSAFMLVACNKGGTSSTPSSDPGQSDPADEGYSPDFSSVAPISVTEYSPETPSVDPSAHNDETYDYDGIKVNPVTNLVNDFAFGADLSAVAEVEANGGVYYDKDGNPGDVFEILADGGVNYCRLRIWNDPYSSKAVDENGNPLSYGGGGNDLATDIYLAKRAKAAGMKVLLDFHYSDHWADPAKFFAPKAWRDLMADELPDTLGEYTAGVLGAFKAAGVTVDSVQIGNEENTGLAGQRFAGAADLIADMVKAGVLASKTVFPEIKTMIHLTNIKTKKSCQQFLAKMAEKNVPYDIVGLSYYPFWHGEKSNLTWMMEYIKDTYNKPSWVVETSYGFTNESTEWASNQYGSHLENAGGYLTSPQGQTSAVRDIVQTIADAKENCGQGCFYWEPAWLPVRGSTWATGDGQYYNKFGRDPYSYKASATYAKGALVMYDNVIYSATEEIATPEAWNPEHWEVAYSEYSCRSAWANQGWFSFSGKVLPSAYTYKYLKDGTKAATENVVGPRETEIEVTVNLSDGITLPETALVTTDFDALIRKPVTWSQSDVAAIVRDGTYTVHGTVTAGTSQFAITATVIAQTNYIHDFSFEEQAEGEQVDVREPWEVTTQVPGAARIEAKSEGNLDGDKYFHWYSTSENTWELKQTFTCNVPGTYDLATRIMAGDMVSDYKVFNIWYEINGGTRVSVSILDKVMGYGEPLNRYMIRAAIDEIVLTEASNTITVGLYCEQAGDAWGHCDVWSFSEHVETEPEAVNYLLDGGFEAQPTDGTLTSPWVLDNNEEGAFKVTANAGNDAVGGDSQSMKEAHCWLGDEFSFGFHQDIAELEAGNYTLTFYAQNETFSKFDKFELYYKIGDAAEVIVNLMDGEHLHDGWVNDPTLVTVSGINLEAAASFTLGFRVHGNAGAWAHWTDLLLTK